MLVVTLLTLLRPWTQHKCISIFVLFQQKSLKVLLELIHLLSVLTDSHCSFMLLSTDRLRWPTRDRNHFNVQSGFTRPLSCFLIPLLTPDLGVNTIIVHLLSSSQVNTRLMQSWVFSCWLNICYGGVRDSVWVEEVKYLFGCVMWRMWPCWLLTQPDRSVLCCHIRP